jgi:hypothetical protein
MSTNSITGAEFFILKNKIEKNLNSFHLILNEREEETSSPKGFSPVRGEQSYREKAEIK